MEDLSDSDIASILAASRFGVLSMADGGRSYAIPIFFGADGHDVYFHCHPGTKDHFIDSSKEACLVVTHVAGEDVWETVQVFGALERLTLNDDIERARDAIYLLPPPPNEGAFPSGKPLRSPESVYFVRLSPTRVSGKQSTWRQPKKD